MTVLALADQRKAIALDPGGASGFLGAASVLRDLGGRDLALLSCERALAIEPRSLQALCNKGVVLFELGRPASALDCYEAALAIEGDHLGVRLNRVAALAELGRLAEARATCRRIIAADPAQFDAWNEFGLASRKDGAPSDALSCFDRALAVWPGSADILCNRGVALEDLKRHEAALASYDAALSLDGRHLQALDNRATVLLNLGRIEESLRSSERALELDRNRVVSLQGRGNALAAMSWHGLAALSFARTIALAPDLADALRNLGNARLLQGRIAPAVASLRRAMAIRPDDEEILANLVFALDFDPDIDIGEQQSVRRRWFEVFRRRLPASIPRHGNDPDPERRLRIGYVSADFKHHSASFIFGPVIVRHDRSAFEVVCYSNVAHADDKTRDFERMADRWREIRTVSDDEVADLVRRDGIDILVDLSGHTAGHRLGVFGRKPAPVQVTGWGTGHGNGMPMIDYLFSDGVSIPKENRHLFAETVVDLPCSMTFDAPAYAPAVGPLPALATGVVTFGSFNRVAKISDRVIRIWSEVLAVVPESRLVMKDPPFDDANVRSSVGDAFVALGIDRSRLDMRGRTPHAEHLAQLGEIDIALDPFPQNGGISTWEALWMGCPVVAKIGHTIPGRAAAAILTSVGVPDWVAEDDAAYVARTVQWANDLSGLARRRETLRRMVVESDSGNPDRYTRRAERAYRWMWKKWCGNRR